MDGEMTQLARDVADIRARNVRVEADKAWEVSWVRTVSIAAITYAVACAVLYIIDVSNFYLAAIVPVVGYLLSTLSLSFIKRLWLVRRG